jgi:hypothetical protein
MIQCLALAAVATQMLATAAVQSPAWEADYGKALAKTRATDNQPLLVVLEKPSSDSEQLTPAILASTSDKESTGTPVLEAYRLCRIDASSEYGKKVAEVFDAEAFPFVAIIDRTGSVILHSQSGPVDAEAFGAKLTQYQDGKRPVRVQVARPSYDEDFSMPVYSQPSSSCPNCQRY